MRKREASVGDADLEMRVEAWVKETVVLWTMRWARSSKTEDWGRVLEGWEWRR